jgi:hypothetical protein
MPNIFEELRSPLIFVSIFYDGHKLYTGAKLVMADARKSKLYVIIICNNFKGNQLSGYNYNNSRNIKEYIT